LSRLEVWLHPSDPFRAPVASFNLVQNFLLKNVSEPAIFHLLEAVQQFCQARAMPSVISVIVQNPTVRAAVLIVLVAAVSFYLGTSPVRRGILYHVGVFAPSVVAAVVAGLSAWSWKWFWLVLLIGAGLTALIQMLSYQFA
jgi:hypothetical protein